MGNETFETHCVTTVKTMNARVFSVQSIVTCIKMNLTEVCAMSPNTELE